MSHRRRLLALASATLLSVAAIGAPTAAQDASEAPSSAAPASAVPAEPVDLGMVIHVIGNPFIQSIADYARIAADDLGATLQVVGPEGGDPDQQIALIQGFVNAGLDGIVTSVPGSTLAEPINAIVDAGVPVVQFNLLDTGAKAPYVGERSTESGRILGRKVVDLLGGESAEGKVFVGICLPGYPVLENRSRGVREGLATAPGLIVNEADFDTTVFPTSNLAAWEAVFTANPDAKAFIGLCALDIPSLAQLQEGAPDTDYVMAGYDLTPQNVAALKDGTADVSLGQTPFMQGYLPVKILVDTLSGATDVDLSQGGFIDAGTEVATADGVELPHGLGTATLDEILAIASDPAAARAFYQPLVDGIIADWANNLEPIENESQ
jgi:ABC-type sugar transport system substrate-binding protein